MFKFEFAPMLESNFAFRVRYRSVSCSGKPSSRIGEGKKSKRKSSAVQRATDAFGIPSLSQTSLTSVCWKMLRHTWWCGRLQEGSRYIMTPIKRVGKFPGQTMPANYTSAKYSSLVKLEGVTYLQHCFFRLRSSVFWSIGIYLRPRRIVEAWPLLQPAYLI